jgi:hypothetical protein
VTIVVWLNVTPRRSQNTQTLKLFASYRTETGTLTWTGAAIALPQSYQHGGREWAMGASRCPRYLPSTTFFADSLSVRFTSSFPTVHRRENTPRLNSDLYPFTGCQV